MKKKMIALISMMVFNSAHAVGTAIDVSQVDGANKLPALTYRDGIIIKRTDDAILAVKASERRSTLSGWAYFFKQSPVVGEIFTVNSQPRLVLAVNQERDEFTFSDIPWDMA